MNFYSLCLSGSHQTVILEKRGGCRRLFAELQEGPKASANPTAFVEALKLDHATQQVFSHTHGPGLIASFFFKNIYNFVVSVLPMKVYVGTTNYILDGANRRQSRCICHAQLNGATSWCLGVGQVRGTWESIGEMPHMLACLMRQMYARGAQVVRPKELHHARPHRMNG